MTTDGTVLLVEDNPDDVALTLRALKKSRVAAIPVVVRDGTAALDYLFGSGAWAGHAEPLPRVVLLDINLPGMDGIEVLRRIRTTERTRMLPVVMLTSSKEEQDLSRGYSLGANSYVQKPVDSSKFLEATTQLSVYWLLLNEPPPDVT